MNGSANSSNNDRNDNNHNNNKNSNNNITITTIITIINNKNKDRIVSQFLQGSACRAWVSKQMCENVHLQDSAKLPLLVYHQWQLQVSSQHIPKACQDAQNPQDSAQRETLRQLLPESNKYKIHRSNEEWERCLQRL